MDRPECILYDAKPHIGTDILEKLVQNIREKIEALGGTYIFDSKPVDLHIKKGCLRGVHVDHRENGRRYIETESLILATGHSSRDTFEMLHRNGVEMEQRYFLLG